MPPAIAALPAMPHTQGDRSSYRLPFVCANNGLADFKINVCEDNQVYRLQPVSYDQVYVFCPTLCELSEPSPSGIHRLEVEEKISVMWCFLRYCYLGDYECPENRQSSVLQTHVRMYDFANLYSVLGLEEKSFEGLRNRIFEILSNDRLSKAEEVLAAVSAVYDLKCTAPTAESLKEEVLQLTIQCYDKYKILSHPLLRMLLHRIPALYTDLYAREGLIRTSMETMPPFNYAGPEVWTSITDVLPWNPAESQDSGPGYEGPSSPKMNSNLEYLNRPMPENERTAARILDCLAQFDSSPSGEVAKMEAAISAGEPSDEGQSMNLCDSFEHLAMRPRPMNETQPSALSQMLVDSGPSKKTELSIRLKPSEQTEKLPPRIKEEEEEEDMEASTDTITRLVIPRIKSPEPTDINENGKFVVLSRHLQPSLSSPTRIAPLDSRTIKLPKPRGQLSAESKPQFESEPQSKFQSPRIAPSPPSPRNLKRPASANVDLPSIPQTLEGSNSQNTPSPFKKVAKFSPARTLDELKNQPSSSSTPSRITPSPPQIVKLESPSTPQQRATTIKEEAEDETLGFSPVGLSPPPSTSPAAAGEWEMITAPHRAVRAVDSESEASRPMSPEPAPSVANSSVASDWEIFDAEV